MENTRFCSREFEVGLEADQIVQRAVRVVAAQLNAPHRALARSWGRAGRPA